MPTLYQYAAQFRAELLAQDAAAAERMVRAYGQAWEQIQTDLARLQQRMQAAQDAGETVNVGWLYREDRLQQLRAQTEDKIRGFADQAGDLIRGEQSRAVVAAQAHAQTLVQASLGTAPPGAIARVMSSFARVPHETLTDLVGFLHDGSPLQKLLGQLPGSAGQSIQDQLIRAVATGQSPRVTARLIRQDLGGDLTRAERIARTETLRSYRESSRRTYAANTDIVDGWIWTASLSARTCPACLAMHGTEHPLSEILDGHPCCRCVMVPKRKTWAELGFEGLPDPPPRETGEEWFARQVPAKQEAILGPAAFAAYQEKTISLSDLVGRRDSPDWGTMRYTRSLKSALADAA